MPSWEGRSPHNHGMAGFAPLPGSGGNGLNVVSSHTKKRSAEPASPHGTQDKRSRSTTAHSHSSSLHRALCAAVASGRPDAVRQVLGDALYEQIRATMLKQAEEHAVQVLPPDCFALRALPPPRLLLDSLICTALPCPLLLSPPPPRRCPRPRSGPF